MKAGSRFLYLFTRGIRGFAAKNNIWYLCMLSARTRTQHAQISNIISQGNFLNILVVVFALFIGSKTGLLAQSPATGLMVGAASGSITPLTACYLAGYGGAGMSVGVHDSLYAKAVVITGQGGSVALLTLDCIGLMHPEVEIIRQKVAKLLPSANFNPGNIVVSSTHTHLGPDVVGLWG